MSGGFRCKTKKVQMNNNKGEKLMITYGFIMPDGKETDMDGRTHAEYAYAYCQKLEEMKKPDNEEWRKHQIFFFNVLGDCLDFVVRGLGWIKVGQYYDGYSKTISVPLTLEDEERRTKKYLAMKEYEQAGWYVDFISVIWWDELEQPPEEWLK